MYDSLKVHPNFQITFWPTGTGRRLTWTRFYVPGMCDYDCVLAALKAMRAEYPRARLFTIVNTDASQTVSIERCDQCGVQDDRVNVTGPWHKEHCGLHDTIPAREEEAD